MTSPIFTSESFLSGIRTVYGGSENLCLNVARDALERN